MLDEIDLKQCGRNFCSELSLACWLVRFGLDLSYDDPADVAGTIADHYLIVQYTAALTSFPSNPGRWVSKRVMSCGPSQLERHSLPSKPDTGISASTPNNVM